MTIIKCITAVAMLTAVAGCWGMEITEYKEKISWRKLGYSKYKQSWGAFEQYCIAQDPFQVNNCGIVSLHRHWPLVCT